MSSFKMVDDRVELARRLESLIAENAETTARALAAILASFSETSEAAWYENELRRTQGPPQVPRRPGPSL